MAFLMELSQRKRAAANKKGAGRRGGRRGGYGPRRNKPAAATGGFRGSVQRFAHNIQDTFHKMRRSTRRMNNNNPEGNFRAV